MIESDYFYLIGGILAIPITYKAIIQLELIIRKGLLVNKEYKNSRGTVHKKLLQTHLKKLTNLISDEERLLKSHNSEKAKINSRKNQDLEVAATRYIFNQSFTSIPGIGKTLKGRVERRVFKGTLDSLNRSYAVDGIGDVKYHAIRSWINTTKRRMPRIIESNFKGKKVIVNKYEKQLSSIRKKISEVKKRIQPLTDLELVAKSELETLNEVTSSTFGRSYAGNMNASDRVTEYQYGLFPEWKRMPIWFKSLMETTT